MVNPQDGRPPYRQVADSIREDIETGRLGPGDSLPSISELTKRFRVTGGTAQRAVNHLRTLGLVETRHGAGSIVTPERRWIAVTSAAWTQEAGDGPLTAWVQLAAEHGFDGTHELVDVAVELPPGDVHDALGLGGEQTAVARKRLLRLDGEPVQLVTSYYPHALADGTPLAERREIKGGAAAVLASLPNPPVDAVEIVSSRMPTRTEAATLLLGPGVPVFRILRTTVDAEGQPIEVMVLVLAAHRHRLLYRLPVG